jgi:phosphoribosyl 1,2-cyclic phosphate phosphodiesterase
VEWQGKSLLIDCSTDFRQQALRADIPRIDAVLFTHPHADHIGGVDDLRAYNFVQRASIPIYAHEWTQRDLCKRYDYIFNPGPVEGGGIAQLDLRSFELDAPQIDVLGLPVIPIRLMHGSSETAGFRFGNVAYLTDCNRLPEESKARLKGLEVLVLDCLRPTPHGTHLSLQESLDWIRELAPQKTYLTHMGHELEHEATQKTLPNQVWLAYDGLRIQLKN